jgi:uncharacterized protein YutE (UPF0331/DUF86 family)
LINVDKIKGKLTNLQSFLDKLRILASIPQEEFSEDFTKVESAKHLLQVSIESCLDIGNHIIASKRFRAPESYTNIFEILVEEGILPEENLEKFRYMAQFRNRLVHLYWDIDADVVYEILQKNLDDFDIFSRQILNYFFNSQN